MKNLRLLRRIIRVLVLKLVRRTDRDLWRQPRQCSSTYDERTERMARLIRPGSRVLEFGAAAMSLKSMLDPTSTYFPSDVVDRGPGTIVCDLNARPLPDFSDLRADVTVLGGVLEYLFDLEEIVAWLPKQAPTCIVSYIAVESPPHSLARVKELAKRSAYAWVNQDTASGLVARFTAAGFRCTAEDRWRKQNIYRFELAESTSRSEPAS